MIVLGIETSCDETAAAIVADGRQVLSSVVSSQVEVHHPYGGVVPELASRKHIENIVPVVQRCIDSAGISPDELDAVAATRGPGLIGALLVGFTFAKAYAYARGIPWVGVNHLEGHLNSVFLEAPSPGFPFVALLASGGHTCIYHVTSHVHMELMGQTRDDAAGEAYDKVAKMLGLGYPGGAIIDALAATGDGERIAFPRPFINKAEFDFSFSGLKTAVSRYLQTHRPLDADHTADIAASFQAAATDVLAAKLFKAAETQHCPRIAVVGGVAANRGLRDKIKRKAAGRNIEVFIPPVAVCGDNAAMIALTGYHYLINGKTAGLADDVYSRNRF